MRIIYISTHPYFCFSLNSHIKWDVYPTTIINLKSALIILLSCTTLLQAVCPLASLMWEGRMWDTQMSFTATGHSVCVCMSGNACMWWSTGEEKKKKPKDISNTRSHHILWLHSSCRTLNFVVENSHFVSVCKWVCVCVYAVSTS